jgi:hypothetical protein
MKRGLIATNKRNKKGNTMKSIQESFITRLAKRLEAAEKQIARMDRAFTQMNVVSCACCNEYYISKDNNLMNTTKGPVCVNCIRDNEGALENCKVAQIDIARVFWDHYKPFISRATVDGKRYISGNPIDPSKGLAERESRDVAMILWDFAESEGIKLRSFGGFMPAFNPSDFKPDGGVWLYCGKATNE